MYAIYSVCTLLPLTCVRRFVYLHQATKSWAQATRLFPNDQPVPVIKFVQDQGAASFMPISSVGKPRGVTAYDF